MCRWIAYSGGALAPKELIYNPEHSLIVQSLAATASPQRTNGDGFGIGWYDHYEFPGLYKQTSPAWNDANLQDVCTHVVTPMFLAHVRAATGTPIQRTNSHPFRHGRWLFVHNGLIRGFEKLKRQLVTTLTEELFLSMTGSTDSEVMFLLALHFGLEEDVCEGVARMTGYIEHVGREAGVEDPLQMTLGIADGKMLYAVRYSSERDSRTLFHSTSKDNLKDFMRPEDYSRLAAFSGDAIAIVSEPLSDMPHAWHEIPESTFVTVAAGEVQKQGFRPIAP